MTDTDTFRDVPNDDAFQARISIVIASIAAMLLVNDLGADNALWEATHENTVAINSYAFYQAKTVRQNDLNLTADTLEAIARTALPLGNSETRRDILELAAKHRAKARSYESEPSSGEGKKELLEQAKTAELLRNKAIEQDPYFDLASMLFQLAIILFSVVLITRRKTLILAASGAAVSGLLLSLNAFTLLLHIPGIG